MIAGSYEAREDEKLIVRFLVIDRSGRRCLSEVLPGSVPGLLQLSSEIATVVRRELRLPLPGADGRKAVDAIYADLPPEAWPTSSGKPCNHFLSAIALLVTIDVSFFTNT